VTASEELQALAARAADACGSAALAWGVVLDGGLAMAGGIGASARTVFRIASMTKSFTAATVLAQRDDGHLRLDDPAPALAGIRATTDSPPITYRHLLSMSAGLPEDDPWADRHMDMASADIATMVAGGLVFAFPTGTAFEYSNLGYVLLGDHASDTTTRLLEPLGMTRTTWVRPEHDDWARPPAGTSIVAHGAFAGMGGLWSCVEDMATWVGWLDDAFPARDGPDDGPLSRASRREMRQVHRAHGAGGGYGFGLTQIHDERFGTIVSHSGGLPGYGSNMRWLPGRRVGVVTLANATYAPMGALAQEMLGVLDDHALVPPAVVPVAAPLERAAASLVALLNAWDDEAADVLFCDNVALDEPYATRAAAAGALVAAHGTMRLQRLEATSATRGSAVVAAAGGTFRVTLMLTPLPSGCIERYTVDQ
jgi:CubicO group peptidase (beta-lactamase class C family)